MTSEKITLEISQDLLAALKIGIHDLGNNIRLLAAVSYFQEKKLSLGKAAQLAGVNRLEFLDILSDRGIVAFDYDESSLKNELEGVSILEQLQ